MFTRHTMYDGGAGTLGSEASTSKAGGQDAGNKDDGKGSGTGDAGSTAADSGGKGTPTPEEQLKAKTEEIVALQTEHDGLLNKYGKQSEQVGSLKKIAAQLTDANPEVRKRLLQGFAKTAGLDINFGTPNPVAKMDGAGDADPAKAAAFDAAKFESEMNLQIRSILDPAQEQMLAQKHPDWDDLTDHRNLLALDVSTSKVGQDELLHYAAKGRDLPNILEVHKGMVIKEYQESLTAKGEGQITGTGAADVSNMSTKKAVETIEEAISEGLLSA